MKYSIVVSGPLRALFLGACLITPRDVQSERVSLDDIIALAPGINRWTDATRRLQDQMDFPRSLESDPSFYELFDDTTTVEYLSEIDLDETFVECMTDLYTFYNETPGIEEANEGANATSVVEIVDMENIAVTVEYPEEDSQILRQKCADAGGYFEITPGEIFCSSLDPETGVTIGQTGYGYVFCMANTPSCTSSGRIFSFEMIALALKAMEFDCEITDASAALDSAGGKNTPSSFSFAGLLIAAISFVVLQM